MKLKKMVNVIFASMLVAVMLAAAVSARVVIDFSKNDYVLGDIGGQGDMEVINDGDRRVVFVECTDGYDPADDPDGTNTKGDLYASVTDFEDYGLDADVYKWMKIRVKNESAAPFFEFHFSSPSKGFNVETSVNLDITPNSDYTEYVFNVPEQSEKYYPKRPADVTDPNNWPDHWQGMINAFRLDFMYYDESGGHARTGDKMYVEYIAFFETKEAAESFVFTPARTTAQIAQEQAEKDAARAEALAAAEAAANADNPAEAADNNNNNSGGEDAAANEAAITTTTASSSSGEDSNNMIMWIVIGAAGVAVVIIIIVVMTGKKK